MNPAQVDTQIDIRAIIFDIGDTLVHAAVPGTPVSELRADPIGAVVNELTQLSKHYLLAAVTDTAAMRSDDVRAALAGSGLSELLDPIVTSVDVGARKPDPRGLQLAMDKLGVTPDQTLFVGDSPVDQGAAQAAGAHYVMAGGGRSPGGPITDFLKGPGTSGGSGA